MCKYDTNTMGPPDLIADAENWSNLPIDFRLGNYVYIISNNDYNNMRKFRDIVEMNIL